MPHWIFKKIWWETNESILCGLTPGLPLGSYTIFETLRIIYRLGAILACEGGGGAL